MAPADRAWDHLLAALHSTLDDSAAEWNKRSFNPTAVHGHDTSNGDVNINVKRHHSQQHNGMERGNDVDEHGDDGDDDETHFESLLQQARELEKQLRSRQGKGASTSKLDCDNEKELFNMRCSLRRLYISLLSSHPLLSASHDVESSMWKSCIYKQIESMRRMSKLLTNACANNKKVKFNTTKQSSSDISRKKKTHYDRFLRFHHFMHRFLHGCMRQYEDIFFRHLSNAGWEAVPPSANVHSDTSNSEDEYEEDGAQAVMSDSPPRLRLSHVILRRRSLPSSSSSSSSVTVSLQSCHRCLIFRGDLERYYELIVRDEVAMSIVNEAKAQEAGDKDGAPVASLASHHSSSHEAAVADTKRWRRTEHFYHLALQLQPGIGNPFNQLAVLATYQSSPLLAVYRYLRALTCMTPFQTAHPNLQLLFSRARDQQMLDAHQSAHHQVTPAKRRRKRRRTNDGGDTDTGAGSTMTIEHSSFMVAPLPMCSFFHALSREQVFLLFYDLLYTGLDHPYHEAFPCVASGVRHVMQSCMTDKISPSGDVVVRESNESFTTFWSQFSISTFACMHHYRATFTSNDHTASSPPSDIPPLDPTAQPSRTGAFVIHASSQQQLATPDNSMTDMADQTGSDVDAPPPTSPDIALALCIDLLTHLLSHSSELTDATLTVLHGFLRGFLSIATKQGSAVAAPNSSQQRRQQVNISRLLTPIDSAVLSSFSQQLARILNLAQRRLDSAHTEEEVFFPSVCPALSEEESMRGCVLFAMDDTQHEHEHEQCPTTLPCPATGDVMPSVEMIRCYRLVKLGERLADAGFLLSITDGQNRFQPLLCDATTKTCVATATSTAAVASAKPVQHDHDSLNPPSAAHSPDHVPRAATTATVASGPDAAVANGSAAHSASSSLQRMLDAMCDDEHSHNGQQLHSASKPTAAGNMIISPLAAPPPFSNSATAVAVAASGAAGVDVSTSDSPVHATRKQTEDASPRPQNNGAPPSIQLLPSTKRPSSHEAASSSSSSSFVRSAGGILADAYMHAMFPLRFPSNPPFEQHRYRPTMSTNIR